MYVCGLGGEEDEEPKGVRVSSGLLKSLGRSFLSVFGIHVYICARGGRGRPKRRHTKRTNDAPAVVGAGVVLAVIHGDPDVPDAVPAVVLLEAVLARALVALVAHPGGAPRVFVAGMTLFSLRLFMLYVPVSRREAAR